MILFHSVRWKNLLSTGNAYTEIKLDRSPSTLIVGKNGGGKSTMMDAISFALYGKPFRKVNKGQLVNSVNNRDCVTEIEFSVGSDSYKVVRGIKPNILEIYKNGVLTNQDSATRDYQEHLEKNVLKMNHRSFSQVVILGSSTYVPFMQLSAVQRREVIEDLLDIQIFSQMNVFLRERVSTNKNDVQESKYKLDLISEKLTLQRKYLSNLGSDRNKKIKESKEEVETLKLQVQGLNEERAILEEKKVELVESIKGEADFKKELTRAERTEISLNDKRSTLLSEINELESMHSCPTCKQDISVESRKHNIELKTESVAVVDGELEVIRADIQALRSQLASIAEVKKEIEKNNQAQGQIVQTINIHKLNARRLFEYVKESQNESDNEAEIQQEIEELLSQQQIAEASREAFINEQAVLNAASAVLKDGGIKTKIIKQYIPIMNKLINKYLASMDFFVQFELDEQFNETIKSRFRDEFGYNSFSEGEKQKIDLALMFTWRAIAKMRNSASTNLLILDEVFDSSLDNNSVDYLLEILKQSTDGSNTFVISHRGDALFDKFRSLITFEKQGNFSKMV